MRRTSSVNIIVVFVTLQLEEGVTYIIYPLSKTTGPAVELTSVAFYLSGPYFN